MNTPASEQECAEEVATRAMVAVPFLLANPVTKKLGEGLRKACNDYDEATALRPPAGVDTVGHTDVRVPTCAHMAWQTENGLWRCCNCGAWKRSCDAPPNPSHTLPAPAVTVEELAEVAYRSLHIAPVFDEDVESWADIMAKEYDRTRDLCLRAAKACCEVFSVTRKP